MNRLMQSLVVSEARSPSAPMSRQAASVLEQRFWIRNESGQWICRMCDKQGGPPVWHPTLCFQFPQGTHGESKEHKARRQIQFELDGLFGIPPFKYDPLVTPGYESPASLSLRNQRKWPANVQPPPGIGHTGPLTRRHMGEYWGCDIPSFLNETLRLIQERGPPPPPSTLRRVI